MGTFSRETLAPDYVTGLVEGAGSFTFSRSSKQLALYFALKNDDRSLLEDLQTYFGGIGRIYERYYRVTRHTELLQIVDHFERFPLRSRKRELFEVWRQMVDAKQRFRRPDRELLDELVARMRERR